MPSIQCQKKSAADLEQIPEVGTAGGEHHPVGADLVSLAAERDVHQLLVPPQVVKHGGHAALEAVPLQTELLGIHHLRGRGGGVSHAVMMGGSGIGTLLIVIMLD